MDFLILFFSRFQEAKAYASELDTILKTILDIRLVSDIPCET